VNVAALSADDSTRCDFSGVYTLQFKPACQQAALGSSFKCTVSTTNVTAILTTSKYCPYLTQLSVGLTGKLTAYSDDALSSSASNFDLGSKAYFKLEVDGDGDVSSVSITQASLSIAAPVSSDITLVSYGSAVTSGGGLDGAEVTLKNSSAIQIRNIASISFKLLQSFIPINPNVSVLATLRVVAGVVFSNTDGSISRRLLTIERNLMPATLLNDEKPKLRRNMAKLATTRQEALSINDNDKNDPMMAFLQSNEPVLRAEIPFILGPATFI